MHNLPASSPLVWCCTSAGTTEQPHHHRQKHTCGGLMMGVDSTDPNTPPLLQETTRESAGKGGSIGAAAAFRRVCKRWHGGSLLRLPACVVSTPAAAHKRSAQPVDNARAVLMLCSPDGEGSASHLVHRQGAVARLATEIVDFLHSLRRCGDRHTEQSSAPGGAQSTCQAACTHATPRNHNTRMQAVRASSQCRRNSPSRAFSTSAKLIWSTSRSTGTTKPLGVATATEMS